MKPILQSKFRISALIVWKHPHFYTSYPCYEIDVELEVRGPLGTMKIDQFGWFCQVCGQIMVFQIRILLSEMSHTDKPADVADPLLDFIKSQRGPLRVSRLFCNYGPLNVIPITQVWNSKNYNCNKPLQSLGFWILCHRQGKGVTQLPSKTIFLSLPEGFLRSNVLVSN